MNTEVYDIPVTLLKSSPNSVRFTHHVNMAPPPSLSESRVLDLVTRYRAVDELHPLVADMFSSQEFEGIFQDALKHEQYIISRRSQDLSDNEITLPQKAFAILWGNRADYYAATALWVEEVLGISVVPVEDKSTVLSTVVKAKSYTLDRTVPP